MNVFAKGWRRWVSRHRSPANIVLHAVGIPTKLGAIPAAILGRWLLAAVLLVVGLGLQFLGHYFEGSRSGEELLVRRLFRRG